MEEAASERAQLAADWERARTAVFAQLLAGIGSFHDAEDVLQETFLTVTAKAASFAEGTNFIGWACTIARFKVLEASDARRPIRLVRSRGD